MGGCRMHQSADLEERNSQVRQMREVYSNAQQALVWLGDAQKTHELGEVEKAMATLQHIYNHSVRPRTATMIRIEPEQIRHIYPALGKVFRRAWFTRVWVLQEVVVASSAIVSGGKTWVPFEIFSSIQWAIRMDKGLNDNQRKAEFGLDLRAYEEFNSVFSNVITYGRQIMDVHLADLLEATSRRQATDPRDKVFGILGLIWPAPDPGVIAPDYSLSVPQVYQKAMVYALNTARRDWTNTRSLAMMQYATNQKSYDLPSWCIDFSVEQWRLRIASISARGSASIKVSGYVEQPPIVHLPARNAILLSGTTIGTIRYSKGIRGQELKEGHESSTFLATMLRFTEISMDALAARIGHEEALEEIQHGLVWNTLNCGGRYLPERPEAPGAPKDTDGVSLIAGYLASQSSDWAKFADFGYDLDLANIPRVRRGISDLAKRYDGCYVFVTDTGYLGIADGAIAEGDVLAILFGLHTPVVLHGCGEDFKLLACTWTQGVMSGEYVEDEESFRKRIFSLI